jgi:RNA polymerase sigma factor (sigma-70 family)
VNLPLARHLARRYAGRGELLDDLYQVASLALIRVVDRYDPARETAFSSYAIPSILGEIKRHFRDSTRGLADLIGGIDPDYAKVDDSLLLRPLLALLSVRDRRILAMRFYANMTQVQIAAEVGLSQMHVSRLLSQSLTRLRTTMLSSPSLPHVAGRA